MLRKLLAPLMIIIAGLMLGTIISIQFSEKNKKNTGTPPTNTQSPTEAVANRTLSDFAIQLSIKLDKTSVKTYDQSVDITKDLASVDKALLTINYRNATNREFKDVKLWLNLPNDGRLDYADSETARSNKEDIVESNLRVYDLPDIKPNETIEAQIWIFGKNPGVHTFSGEIRSDSMNEVSNRSNEATLTLK